MAYFAQILLTVNPWILSITDYNYALPHHPELSVVIDKFIRMEIIVFHTPFMGINFKVRFQDF